MTPSELEAIRLREVVARSVEDRQNPEHLVYARPGDMEFAKLGRDIPALLAHIEAQSAELAARRVLCGEAAKTLARHVGNYSRDNCQICSENDYEHAPDCIVSRLRAASGEGK